MKRWVAYRGDEQLVGGMYFEICKNVLLDHLSFEADRALDNHDLTTREDADGAWADLDLADNTEFSANVNGVVFALRMIKETATS